MKRFIYILLLFVILLVSGCDKFSDIKLKRALKDIYPDCFDANDNLIIEIAETKRGMLNLKYGPWGPIESLEGLQYFNNIDSLDISFIQVFELPELSKNLTYLDCSTCGLNSLPKLPKSLEYLNCSENELTEFPELPNLIYLDLTYNKITNITLPKSLMYLYCSHNSLQKLPELPKSLIELKSDLESWEK